MHMKGTVSFLFYDQKKGEKFRSFVMFDFLHFIFFYNAFRFQHSETASPPYVLTYRLLSYVDHSTLYILRDVYQNLKCTCVKVT